VSRVTVVMEGLRPPSERTLPRSHTPEGRFEMFLEAVADEALRARSLFPDPDGLVTALGEEVGEVCRAVLDETPERIREECVQVAAMALRLALEGDPTLDALRAARAKARDKKNEDALASGAYV
jgi:NTP pyrophosphatase (non-canonical NTP hydrolase)